ncbi:hypothetical protein [Nostoc sp. FACHB-133]|uniref:hypothetical protein n=1 Tax=Nostoc sp. FACHB-133 TaxID=2692835 RepID=UPI001689420F|nr:hypothetical protein [Nostoc sp. FACHB-133]MBD2527950.1 hypothetical protein [Nostoc sp. FACHB-133]
MSIFESILVVIRDSSWQFIGVVIALVALFFAYKQWNRKSLVYSVISKSNILSIPSPFNQQLEIKYNQKLIKSLYVVSIILKNNGNIAIVPDDFKQYIEIRGGDNKHILSYAVIETKPEDIKVKLDLNTDSKGGYVVIEPLLLNKKDSLTIQLLFEDFDKISIQGRIVGVEKIKQFDYSFNNNLYPLILVGGLLAISFGLIVGINYPLSYAASNIYIISITMGIMILTNYLTKFKD